MKFINYFSLIHVEKSIISIELNRTRIKKENSISRKLSSLGETVNSSEKRIIVARLC